MRGERERRKRKETEKRDERRRNHPEKETHEESEKKTDTGERSNRDTEIRNRCGVEKNINTFGINYYGKDCLSCCG